MTFIKLKKKYIFRKENAFDVQSLKGLNKDQWVKMTKMTKEPIWHIFVCLTPTMPYIPQLFLQGLSIHVVYI